MQQISRRDLLLSLGAFALSPGERAEPELILHNGSIWTVNERAPRAQAVAVSGGRFLAVGSDDEVPCPRRRPRTARSTSAGRRSCPASSTRTRTPATPAVAPSQAGRLRPALDRGDSGRHPRARGEDAARPVGPRLQVRRHEDRRGPAAHARGPRRGRARPPGLHRATAAGTPPMSTRWRSKAAGVTERRRDPPGGHFGRDPAPEGSPAASARRATEPFRSASIPDATPATTTARASS